MVFHGRALAEDQWMAGRSANFYITGNADAQKLRDVAARLEQFRDFLGRALERTSLSSPIPTSVIVFKNPLSFKPYKPLHSDGTVEERVDGYFLGGEDVNYIALSGDGEADGTYGLIFHEYTHFIIDNNFGRNNVPAWFHEGLAEYYQTVRFDDQSVTVGLPQPQHLARLHRDGLIPFEIFFNTDNYALHEQGDDGVGMFYAQAWALMHFLQNSEGRKHRQEMYKFLGLVMDKTPPREAFKASFGMGYDEMEALLKAYIDKGDFAATKIALTRKLAPAAAVDLNAISAADAKASLGDLLYHAGRLQEAEDILREAVAGNPTSSRALSSLGLVRLSRGEIDQAKALMEKAVAVNAEDYLALYDYAYVLSRYGMSEFGFVDSYPASAASKIRSALKKSIEINPSFGPAYDLLAFVAVARNDDLDEAETFLKRALDVAPGNQSLQMRLAEVNFRNENFAAARQIAQKVAATTPDRQLKLYAQNTLMEINSTERELDDIRHNRRIDNPAVDYKPVSEEEIARRREKALLESLNQALRVPKRDEQRIVARVEKIQCGDHQVVFSVADDTRLRKFKTPSLENITVSAFSSALAGMPIGCGTVLKDALAVITFKEPTTSGAPSDLVAVEFVPDNFKFPGAASDSKTQKH
jgi:tetratricopeptide (TPR) repeat protein